MGSATVVFRGSLQDLLPRARRGATLQRAFAGSPAVKDVLESLGVPHPEIETVEVDGRRVGLEHRLVGGETVVAYPPAAAAASSEGADPPRFALDGHLGRLAAYLRALGCDTWYRADATDDELAQVVADDPRRILLTRDVGLLKRRVVRHGGLVRDDDPHDQLVAVAGRFGLVMSARPFTRCLRCNGVLEPLERSAAGPRVPPRVLHEQASFRGCPDCGGVFWRGSHHRRLSALLGRLLPGLALGGSRP
jgi:hypothetical protein